jgi:acetylornithine/N-succinyldiaminopimelate aminotransferase
MNMIEKEKKYFFHTYKRYNLILEKARGKFAWDDKGKKYLDLFSGISVNNFGHCHPKIVKAITAQAKKLIHASNYYYVKTQIGLAQALIEKTFSGKVFFANSGAEANECAIKLARKWAKGFWKTDSRYEIIVFENSFHGRTMATLSASGQDNLKKGFEPLLEGFKQARFNDIDSVRELVGPKTIGIMLEPVMGEGGVIPAGRAFLKELRKLCDRNRLLLILDEIQTGLGRTGANFAYEHFEIIPDILTIGKSLGGGIPLAAVVAKDEIAEAFHPGDHGTTFGGNILACAASAEVLKLLDKKTLKQVRDNGNYFVKKLTGLKKLFPDIITEVRGMGLMIGVQLAIPGAEVVEYMREKGVLMNCVHGNVLRFLPPFIINKQDIDKAVKLLEGSFKWIKSKK